MNGAYTMTSSHDIGKATVLKMLRNEGFAMSEIGDVKADHLMATTFELFTFVIK